MGLNADRIAGGLQRTRKSLTLGRQIILLVAFLVSAGVGYTGYQRVAAPSTAAIADPVVTVTRGTIAATVSATGNVIPDKQAKLTFPTSGTVSQVNVALGDKVKAGQVLAKLNTTDLENKLAQAKSTLSAAQIKLNQLKSPATPADVAAAKAALNSAEAKYNDLVAGPKDADMKAAEQAVSSAQAALTKAQDDLATLKAGPTQDVIAAAKADLDKKTAALQQAQAAYDKVAWRGDIQARPESVALQQATADYQASLAAYNQKIAPPNPQDVATDEKAVESAKATLAAAQAKLDQLKAGPTQADVKSAQADIANAKAQLDLKTTPATDLDIAAQQEVINQAQLAVNQAQSDLDKASLTSPFDGVIAAVSMNAGEQSSANSYITIVDPTAVRVDVSVAETDLAKISVGKPAEVTFDALPNTNIQGKVIAISPNSTVQQGVVTYVVSLRFDTQGLDIPPGLTANVNIIVDQRNNVLEVPNRAVKTQGRSRVVQVLVDGKPQTKPVTVGLSNDQMTEITSGLSEGDQVLIPMTTSAAP